MGYVRQRKTYRLQFEDEELKGLVVKVRSTSVGNLLDVLGLLTVAEEDFGAEDVKRLEKLFVAFSDALVEWNVEEEGGAAVPATYEGVRSQDNDFILDIARVWTEAMTGVPAPLGQPLPNGKPSAEPSLPMEALSPSPNSSP